MIDLKREILSTKLKVQQMKLLRIQNSMRPSNAYGTIIERFGSGWKCTLQTFDNDEADESTAPVAYGNTPHEAMVAFDHLWYNPAEEEEEPF